MIPDVAHAEYSEQLFHTSHMLFCVLFRATRLHPSSVGFREELVHLIPNVALHVAHHALELFFNVCT